MGKKRLIYVSLPYTGAVVEGQVYELLEYYKEQNWFDDVLLLQSFVGETDKQKALNILKKFSFRYKVFWMNPNYPFFYRKSIKSLNDALIGDIKDNTVFHVRAGIMGSYVLGALPKGYENLKILDEFRGLLLDELKYTSQTSIIEKIKISIKKKHILNCNKKLQSDNRVVFTAVSPLLKEIEAKEEGFDINRISMHPNIAAAYFKYDSQRRQTLRKELGVSDEQILVVTSSGESGAWQKDLDIIDTLTAKGYVVLNLSKKTIDKPNVISRFVPHKEMPAYLSACDAALLWRDNVPLNNVACPSKYCEFATMGLYVIHNKTVDIATRFIGNNNCGQLVDRPDEIKLSLNLFSEEARMQRCKEGFKVFSIEAIARSYYNILTQ